MDFRSRRARPADSDPAWRTGDRASASARLIVARIANAIFGPAKNLPCTFLKIVIYSPPSRLFAEGRIAIVTDVERGMRWAQRVAAWFSMRTNDPVRTVKSCGLGAAVLASNCGADDARRDDGGNKAVPRREHV